MISAKSAHEIARPSSTGVADIVNERLFYIEQYVRNAAGRGLTHIAFILADELLERPQAADALITELRTHEFTVNRKEDEENTLLIAWDPPEA